MWNKRDEIAPGGMLTMPVLAYFQSHSHHNVVQWVWINDIQCMSIILDMYSLHLSAETILMKANCVNYDLLGQYIVYLLYTYIKPPLLVTILKNFNNFAYVWTYFYWMLNLNQYILSTVHGYTNRWTTSLELSTVAGALYPWIKSYI